MNFGLKNLYVNGELREPVSANYHDVICPGNEEVIARLAWGSREDTMHALEAAEKGFLSWSALSVGQRAEWMLSLRQEIISKQELLRTSIMYEMGKVWEGTKEDFDSIVNSLEFYAHEIQKREDIIIEDREGTHTHRVISQPLGVVVAFLSYNFPLLNLGFKLGPALAAGCSIIIKPSEHSPLSAYILGEICAEINFPKGVINIICGDASEVGIPLSESTIPRLVTMIGSTETALKLIAQSSATSIKRYSMECGGNAPFIVFPDADFDQAVNIGAALKIGNAGQICVAPNRFFIHHSIIDDYIEQLSNRFSEVKLGFGRENKPDMGPLAFKAAVANVHAMVETALSQGGELVIGGSPVDRSGYYYQPTIIRMNDPHASILKEEVFGPVAYIIPFTTKEDVLEYANDTDSGLVSYIFSKDAATTDYFIEKLEFGEVQVNGVKYDIYLPHGGIKNSGVGVDCSIYALDDYLIRKRVSAVLQ